MLYRFLAFAALVYPLQALESNKPNIIILADDMGYTKATEALASPIGQALCWGGDWKGFHKITT